MSEEVQLESQLEEAQEEEALPEFDPVDALAAAVELLEEHPYGRPPQFNKIVKLVGDAYLYLGFEVVPEGYAVVESE